MLLSWAKLARRPSRLIVWLICFLCLLQSVLFGVTRLNTSTRVSVTSIIMRPDDLINEVWGQLKTEYNKLNYMNYCPPIPSNITGPYKIKNVSSNYNATMDIPYFNLSLGGHYKPSECQARHRVLIVIPYKNRLQNLNQFVFHMHPFLQRQQLEYTIIVAEQSNDALFNKGVLMNAAFLEACGNRIEREMKKRLRKVPSPKAVIDHSFDCVIFHDVDLLPEDDRIMYSCPSSKARHLSVAIDKYRYKMLYENLIGGVLNFRRDHYIKVNGYSNEYWAWGAEDDDMTARLTNVKIGFERPNVKLARYTMLKHEKRTLNPKRHKLLKTASRRHDFDGLNSVQYRLVKVIKYRMFTHLLIDVGNPPKDLIQAIAMANTTKSTLKRPRSPIQKLISKWKNSWSS